MKRFIVSLLAMAILCAFSTVTYAAQAKKMNPVEEYVKTINDALPKAQKNENSCVKKSDSSDFEMKECQGEHITVLEKIYENMMQVSAKVLSKKTYSLVQADNKSWNNIREQVGQEAWDACGGGTMSGLCSNGVHIGMYEDRIKWLGDLLKTRSHQLESNQ